MTNIFPYEALAYYLDNDSIDINDKKAVKKILTAQINYEFRDVQLSLFARYNKDKIYRRDGKRYINFRGLEYPFKQSAPHKLVDLILSSVNGSSSINGQLLGKNYLLMYRSKGVFDLNNNKSLFFCSKKYTEATGIESQLLKDYKTCIKMYINYIQWKLDNKKENKK